MPENTISDAPRRPAPRRIITVAVTAAMTIAAAARPAGLISYKIKCSGARKAIVAFRAPFARKAIVAFRAPVCVTMPKDFLRGMSPSPKAFWLSIILDCYIRFTIV